MNGGKTICAILRDIRKSLAVANGIKYIPAECTHTGECMGTCPACEVEARYIERQLSARRAAGKAVVIAGMALGAALPAQGQAVTEVGTDTIFNAAKEDTTDLKVFGLVEMQPSFPGGTPALLKYLRENLRCPAGKEEISGRVIVMFTIERDGSITDVEIVRGLDPELDAEALRVVRNMPRWRPGMVYDKKVAVKYTIPISFGLR